MLTTDPTRQILANPHRRFWGNLLLWIVVLVGMFPLAALAQDKESTGQKENIPFLKLAPNVQRWLVIGLGGAVAVGVIVPLPWAWKRMQAQSLQQKVTHKIDTGELNEAIALMKIALERDSQSPKLHALMGDIFAQKGDWVTALQHYRITKGLKPDFISIDGNFAKALKFYGITLLAKAELAKAIAHFREALPFLSNERSERALCYYYIGFALAHYEDKTHWNQAISELKTAFKMAPDTAEAYCGYALVQAREGQHDDAIASCWLALDINTSLADAHYIMGNSLYLSGQLRAALSAYRIATSLLPHTSHYLTAYLRVNLGLALLHAGKLGPAGVEFKHALALAPGLCRAQYGMGMLLEAQGDFKGAERRYEMASSINPDCKTVIAAMGLNFLAQKKQGMDGKRIIHAREVESAALKFDLVIDQDPQVAEAHFGMAEIFRIRGGLVFAVQNYQAAIKANGSYTDAYYRMGSVLARLNNRDEAIEAFRRTLDLNPHYPEAHATLHRLLTELNADPMTEIVPL